MELNIPPLKPGQVLVKVAYTGVCHSQLMEWQGWRGPDPYLPHLLGHEGSGEVIGIGERVTKVAEGDKVVLTWIKGNGIDCSGTVYEKDGIKINSGPVTTFSDYTVVSENRCVKLPAGVPMDVASLLGCAVPTGAGVVLNSVQPTEKDSLVVWGVGGIGLSAIMAARSCGCAVIIAVDIEDSKLGQAQDYGATHVVNASVEDPLDRIRTIVGEAGVDFAVEAAGQAQTIELAFEAVRRNGGLCVFASHPPYREKIRLDPFELICGKQIRGSWGGESQPDRDIPRYAELYRQKKLPLEKLITHRLTLEEINEAFAILSSGKAGRVLLETHA